MRDFKKLNRNPNGGPLHHNILDDSRDVEDAGLQLRINSGPNNAMPTT
jgi:hypothetical protein